MFYHWLGWISFAMCFLLLAKYLGRILNNKSVNMLLRKIHKPLGIAVIGIGAIHGLISFIKHPQEFSEIFSGVLLWVLIAFLARTYKDCRNLLKGDWNEKNTFWWSNCIGKFCRYMFDVNIRT